MALYAALLYQPADQYWIAPADQADQADQAHQERPKASPEYQEFMTEAMNSGVVRGGEALFPPEMSTTVTVSGGKGGDVIVSDGPYAEAKEVLGGFFLLEAADLDEAIKWGAKIPVAWRGGKVELRPVVPLQK